MESCRLTQGFGGGSAASVVVAAMAKIVLCLVLVVTMVVAAHARVLLSGSDGFPEVRYQTATGGRLVRSESFGSTEAVERDNYQTDAYDFNNRMQEDTSLMTNSFSDSFPTETFPNSFAADDNSFATETNNFVNPGQGVSYNYATDTTATDKYEEGIEARRSAGIGGATRGDTRGATGGGDGKAASFTLEGNTEKTDSVVWTESDP